MVIAKLQLVPIREETVRGDATVLDQFAIGVAPEPIGPVDMDPALSEAAVVIHPQVPVATKSRGIIPV